MIDFFPSPMNADWYFDFISPYSYLGLGQIETLPASMEIRLRPVLFAALLDHWGQLGPAEIPPKRLWTYRWCTWYAEQQGIPFRMPAAHPFNPLPYLRLAIAAGCTQSSIREIFTTLWTTGIDPRETREMEVLAARLGINPAMIEQQDIKDQLKQNTDRAISAGVFGVPTLVIDSQLFWGTDSMSMVHGYLADRSLFESTEMKRLNNLPTAAQRKNRT